jgi:hypothetical protein
MILNGKDIIIFDYLIKPYFNRLESGYNREIRVYVENNIRKQFEDMGNVTRSNKKIYLFLIKD